MRNAALALVVTFFAACTTVAADPAGKLDLRAGLEKLRWTDTKDDVRKKYPSATPQSEALLANVDSLTVRDFFPVVAGVRLEAMIEFDGSAPTSRVARVVFLPVPTDYDMTDAKLEAAWKFISDRLSLGRMPWTTTNDREVGGAKVDILRDPGNFGVVVRPK